MKSIYFWLLAAGFFLLLSGCGRTMGQTGEAAAESTGEETAKEPETITLKWGLFAGSVESLAQCESQLNEELKSRGLSYRVEFAALGDSYKDDYETYVNSYIEDVKTGDCDIVECGGRHNSYDLYEIMADAGALASWNQWLDGKDVGKLLREAYPENIWEELTYQGQIYGLPTINTGIRYYGVWNLDFAEKYQLRPKEVSGGSLEEYLPKVMDGEKKEGNSSFIPLASWPNLLLENYESSNCELIAVCTEGGRLRAENLLYNEDYLEQSGRMNRWRKEGMFVYRPETAQMKNGNFLLAGIYSYSEKAAESQCRAVYALPEDIRLEAVEIPEFKSGFASTRRAAPYRTGIAEGSLRQKEAFALLSVIYSDESLSSLLAYGREGENYSLENGKVVRRGENSAAAFRAKWLGNSLLTLPDLSDSEEKKKEFWESIENLNVSAQHGIAIYDEEMRRKISAINTMAMEEYSSFFTSGSENWEQELEKLRNRAKELGIEEVVEEMNRRFEEAG